MKVLILTVSMGQGHNVTAQAIAGRLEERGAFCRIVDIMEYSNPHLTKAITRSYLWTARKLPVMYRTAYNIAEKEHYLPVEPLSVIMEHVYLTELAACIADFEPDCVFSTHVFAALAASKLKKRPCSDVPFFGLVTDYCIHPYWSQARLDYLITASPFQNREALRKGIPRGKILPLGIPLRPQFYHSVPKEEARRTLGLHPGKATVMLAGGGLGYGRLDRILAELDHLPEDFQVISICGGNSELKETIDARHWQKEIHNYGYVDNIHLMMDAADFLVSKPGGITVTESIAKRLPLIMLKPIPGQEERNAEFLLTHKGGLLAASQKKPADLTQVLLNKPRLRKKLQRNIARLSRGNSNETICNFILDGRGGRTTKAGRASFG